MEKYEGMKNNKPLFTLAESIEMGEWQAEMIMEENKKEAFQEGEQKGIDKGKEAGIKEGIKKGKQDGASNILQQQILLKFKVDASKWLSTLHIKQLEQVSIAILTANTFEELQQVIK